MAMPADAPRKNVYRLSVSENIYKQIVYPLADLLFGEKPTHADLKDIKGTLTELHKSFWNLKGPLAFPGAVAGRFEELLLPLRNAMVHDGRYIKIGADKPQKPKDADSPPQPKKGGDMTVYKTDGRVITYQLKVSNAANENALIEHINKAGAQLTGETGELPEGGSERVIYLLVQNTEAFESYTIDQWKKVVEKALDKDYSSDNRTVTATKIKQAVDRIKIYTKNNRFRLAVSNGKVVIPSGAVKDASQSKFFAFTDSKLETHWQWLVKWFKDNVEAQDDKGKKVIEATKVDGVASKADAWQNLPKQE